MSTPRWTPGPWGLESATRDPDGSDLVITDRDGGYTVAVCRSPCGVPDVETAEANALLIAAAPDMAETLLAIAEEGEKSGAEHPIFLLLAAHARAALAKAVQP